MKFGTLYSLLHHGKLKKKLKKLKSFHNIFSFFAKCIHHQCIDCLKFKQVEKGRTKMKPPKQHRSDSLAKDARSSVLLSYVDQTSLNRLKLDYHLIF